MDKSNSLSNISSIHNTLYLIFFIFEKRAEYVGPDMNKLLCSSHCFVRYSSNDDHSFIDGHTLYYENCENLELWYKIERRKETLIAGINIFSWTFFTVKT